MTHPTPTDLAAMIDGAAGWTPEDFASQYPNHDRIEVLEDAAREYLRLLPTIQAVCARKAEWDAADQEDNMAKNRWWDSILKLAAAHGGGEGKGEE